MRLGMTDPEIFGAFAFVRIRFDGSLQSLANKLCVALNISSFTMEPSEYPPHDMTGSTEALGWGIWLEAAKACPGSFDLRMETEHAVEEVFHGRMHDISPWLARFLSMMCNLSVTPILPDSPTATLSD